MFSEEGKSKGGDLGRWGKMYRLAKAFEFLAQCFSIYAKNSSCPCFILFNTVKDSFNIFCFYFCKGSIEPGTLNQVTTEKRW